MKIIFSDNTKKIIKAHRRLTKELNVKIKVKDKEVTIEGNPEDEFIAEKIIDALSFDFPVDTALLIKNEDFLFEILSIKDHTHRKDMESIRARLIGKKGGTLRTLQSLTDCYFELKDNEIGIIGAPEYIENAQKAVISLVQGSKQANVYAFRFRIKRTEE
jgi:rRNA processing protein Krr1/Pno1